MSRSHLATQNLCILILQTRRPTTLRGKGLLRYILCAFPTWSDHKKWYLSGETMAFVGWISDHRENKGKPTEKELDSSPVLLQMLFTYLGSCVQVGRTLVNPPFPTLLSTLFNPLPLSDSGLLTSLGSCSSWGFWNLVSFLWKTVIWSSCTAWSCCFLDEINHLKLALTSKLEPSSVFSFLPPTCSLNVPWLRPLLTTWVGGSGDAFNKQRGNWLRSQNCSIRGQSFGNNHHFQECFTNNFLLNIEKCFSLGTST